jgi:hypothetical protein
LTDVAILQPKRRQFLILDVVFTLLLLSDLVVPNIIPLLVLGLLHQSLLLFLFLVSALAL